MNSAAVIRPICVKKVPKCVLRVSMFPTNLLAASTRPICPSILSAHAETSSGSDGFAPWLLVSSF